MPSSPAELAAFYEFRDFPHFSQVYGAVSGLVREPADVAELVLGAARDLAGQNARYAELTVTPYTFTSAGMPVTGLTEALDIAARSAGRDHGVRMAYIFDIAGEYGGAGRVRDPGARANLPARGAGGLRAGRDRAGAAPFHRVPVGVPLNSDDPPMFGTTLTDEYRRAASVLGLSRVSWPGWRRTGCGPRSWTPAPSRRCCPRSTRSRPDGRGAGTAWRDGRRGGLRSGGVLAGQARPGGVRVWWGDARLAGARQALGAAGDAGYGFCPG